MLDSVCEIIAFEDLSGAHAMRQKSVNTPTHDLPFPPFVNTNAHVSNVRSRLSRE